MLITDMRLPERHRVLYAVEHLGGMRINEIGPRTWRDWLDEITPLGKLVIDTCWDPKKKVLKPATKTGGAREMPVHPTLARILAAWRDEGWARCYGRQPGPDDYIIPAVDDGILSSSSSYKRLQEDLELLGRRRRRQHDTRRTFISLARADGAVGDLLRWTTHGPEGDDIVDSYTTPPWHTLCEQVAMLKFTLPEGWNPSGSTEAVTSLLRQEKHSMVTATSAVEAEGIEPTAGVAKTPAESGSYLATARNHSDSTSLRVPTCPDSSRPIPQAPATYVRHGRHLKQGQAPTCHSPSSAGSAVPQELRAHPPWRPPPALL